jgi:hypothetical protein
MSKIRADIVNTGNPRLKTAVIEIFAEPAAIFEYLADPRSHQKFDGSNSIKGVNWGPTRLSIGAKFGMKMKIGINYRITNRVVEFEENKLIAWRHLGRWIWRYELEQTSKGKTRVTESFDGRNSPFQWWLRSRGAYHYVEKAVAKSLVKLKQLVEEPTA